MTEQGKGTHRRPLPRRHVRRPRGLMTAVLLAIGLATVLATLDVTGTVDVKQVADSVVAGPSGSTSPSAGASPTSGPTSAAPAGSPTAIGPTPGSASPSATSRPTWRQPQPFVQPFARAPRSAPRRPGPRRAGTPLPRGVDGCDHSYGTAQQCVPWTFPKGVTDRCGWLAKHGLKSLKAKAGDRLALDRNKDGIACGPGDTT